VMARPSIIPLSRALSPKEERALWVGI